MDNRYERGSNSWSSKVKISPRRLLALIAQFAVFILLLGWIGFVPIQGLSPPAQTPTLQTITLYYPPSASAGIDISNTSAVSYMQVSVQVVAVQPILTDTAVSVSGFGCMTAPMAKGLQQVVIQFPQAAPTNPLSPTGSNLVLLPTSTPNSYCGGIMFGGEMFLNETTMSLEWPSPYTSTPTMTLEYQNGTERSSTSSNSIVIQSPDDATFWTIVAGKAALATFVIILIQQASRENRQKDEELPIYVEKFTEHILLPLDSRWSIRVWANKRLEHVKVFYTGTQLPIFVDQKVTKGETVIVKGGGENFRIPSTYGTSDDAIVRVQDGSKTIFSKKWGEIAQVSP